MGVACARPFGSRLFGTSSNIVGSIAAAVGAFVMLGLVPANPDRAIVLGRSKCRSVGGGSWTGGRQRWALSREIQGKFRLEGSRPRKA